MSGPETPLAAYEGRLLRRKPAFAMFALWFAVMIPVAAMIFDALPPHGWLDPVSTAGIALGLFALFSTCSLAFVLNDYRRRWELFADRLQIVERPVVPLAGLVRRAAVPLADVSEVSLVESASEPAEFYLWTSNGRRFGIAAAKTVGTGVDRIDRSGFTAFLSTLETAFATAGLARPPARKKLGVFDTMLGLVLLSSVLVLSVAAALVSFTASIVSFDITMFLNGLLLGVLSSGLWYMVKARWRERRARNAEAARSTAP